MFSLMLSNEALGDVQKLFVITLVARPREDTEAFRESGGSYVVAWVDTSSENQALEHAQREVREAGRLVESINAVALLQRTDYDEGDPSLEYFDQALIDGVVLVFHTWPVNPQEDEPVH